MTIETWVQKAIEGGWGSSSWRFVRVTKSKKVMFTVEGYFRPFGIPLAEMVINPDAWRAVGKVRPNTAKGVGHVVLNSPVGYALNEDIDFAEYSMMRMVHALCDGKTLEAFIATL